MTVETIEDGDVIITTSGLFADRHVLSRVVLARASGGLSTIKPMMQRGWDVEVRRKLIYGPRSNFPNVMANLGPISDEDARWARQKMHEIDDQFVRDFKAAKASQADAIKGLGPE